MTAADPTRRAVLARLATGEAAVTELAEPFDMSLPAIPRRFWEQSSDRLDDYLRQLKSKERKRARKKWHAGGGGSAIPSFSLVAEPFTTVSWPAGVAGSAEP